MRHRIRRWIPAAAPRLLAGTLLLAILVSASADTSRAMQIIPMQKDNSVQFPMKCNPDFRSTSLGLAIKF